MLHVLTDPDIFETVYVFLHESAFRTYETWWIRSSKKLDRDKTLKVFAILGVDFCDVA